jgi:hypothetical protein
VYVVFRYSTAKDEITINYGDENAYERIAKQAKLRWGLGGVYETPVGWLAGYLEKNGSDTIFPASKDEKYTRVKE